MVKIVQFTQQDVKAMYRTKVSSNRKQYIDRVPLSRLSITSHTLEFHPVPMVTVHLQVTQAARRSAAPPPPTAVYMVLLKLLGSGSLPRLPRHPY